MPRLVLFIDDGGVMNDNAVRGPQWQRLVGEFFAPRLGGAPEAWAEANRVVATELWEEHTRSMCGRVDVDVPALLRVYRLAWVRGMCERVGVPSPPEEGECLELEARASAYVTRRVRAAFPGAVEAIRTLRAQGYELHTASGEDSLDLQGYLEGMGIRSCFGRLYGPDLVNALKEGSLYYTRIFADAGVAPADALVIDDNPLPLGWAARAGARTALVGGQPGNDARPDLVLTSLADLPGAIRALE